MTLRELWHRLFGIVSLERGRVFDLTKDHMPIHRVLTSRKMTLDRERGVWTEEEK